MEILCTKCKINEADYYHPTQQFVCADCLPFCHSYLVDNYYIQDGKLICEPLDLDMYKGKDMLYVMIDDWNANLERQYKNLLKTYTPTQIARAVEYRTFAVGDKSIKTKHNLAAIKFHMVTADLFYIELHKQIKIQMEQLVAVQHTTRTIKRRK